ncbi:hypothetical protein BC940DRAFT_336191 [Gongronella butleri]|nr:hypothetical protein BC940DRAFT_336191 [Gongronella butleri]
MDFVSIESAIEKVKDEIASWGYHGIKLTDFESTLRRMFGPQVPMDEIWDELRNDMEIDVVDDACFQRIDKVLARRDPYDFKITMIARDRYKILDCGHINAFDALVREFGVDAHLVADVTRQHAIMMHNSSKSVNELTLRTYNVLQVIMAAGDKGTTRYQLRDKMDLSYFIVQMEQNDLCALGVVKPEQNPLRQQGRPTILYKHSWHTRSIPRASRQNTFVGGSPPEPPLEPSSHFRPLLPNPVAPAQTINGFPSPVQVVARPNPLDDLFYELASHPPRRSAFTPDQLQLTRQSPVINTSLLATPLTAPQQASQQNLTAQKTGNKAKQRPQALSSSAPSSHELQEPAQHQHSEQHTNDELPEDDQLPEMYFGIFFKLPDL